MLYRWTRDPMPILCITFNNWIYINCFSYFKKDKDYYKTKLIDLNLEVVHIIKPF